MMRGGMWGRGPPTRTTEVAGEEARSARVGCCTRMAPQGSGRARRMNHPSCEDEREVCRPGTRPGLSKSGFLVPRPHPSCFAAACPHGDPRWRPDELPLSDALGTQAKRNFDEVEYAAIEALVAIIIDSRLSHGEHKTNERRASLLGG